MFKMNLKKALALLASVLMLCSLVPVGALLAANADSNNVVANGDFENEGANWAFNSGSHEFVSDANGGSKALKLTNPNQWGEAAIQTITADANSEYKITWYSKRVSGSGAFNLIVCQTVAPWGNAQTVSGQNWMNETSGNWVKNEYVIKTGSDTSYFFKFTSESTNAGTILIDDITMTKVGGGAVPPPPASGNLLQNGDFETGDTTGWENVWGSNTVSMVAGRDSANALSITSGLWKIVRQKVTVEANTDYVIKVWAKDVKDMTLLIKDGADTTNIKQTTVNGGSNWVETTLELNTGSYTEIFVCFMGNVADSKGTFDDALMYKKGEEPTPPPASGNLIVNGDFETGDIAPWDNLWGSNTVSMVAGRDSANAIKVAAGQWTHVRQTVAVEANTDYVITVWGKDVTETALLVKDGADTVNVAQTTLLGGADWTKTTLEFNSGANTSILVSFMGNVPGSGYTVDDVVMTKKGEPTPPPVGDNLIVNGDFETGDIAPWDNLWGSNTVSMVAGRDSANAIKVAAGQWTHVRQAVAVEANTDYVITVWGKDVTETALLVKDGADTANVAQTTLLGGTNWTKTTLEFNSGANTNILVSFMGNVPGSGYTVDDVVMTKKGNEPGGDDPIDPTYPTELINGDFEDGSNGWTLNDSFASIVSDARHGSGALKLENPSAWAEAAMQTVSVQKNTNYVITWYAKRVSGNGPFNLVLNNGNQDYKDIGQTWMNETSGEWVKYEVVVPTGDNTIIRFKFTSERAESGVVLIDDVKMIIEGSEPVDPTASLIKNGSFEEGKDDWSWGGESQVLEGDYYEGAHSAKLVNNSAWGVGIEQVVKVEKNTDYVLRFYTKRVTGEGVWRLSLMDNDTVNITNVNLETTSGQAWFKHTTTNKWEEHIVEFNSGEVTKVLVKFGPETDNAGSFLIDYIGMWTKGNEPSPDNPDNPVVPPKAQMFMTSFGVLNNRPIDQDSNMLVNGSFEKSGGQWKEGFKGETISVVNDSTTLFGDKSLFFNTAGIEEETKLIFWVDVEPDTAYVFSTWLKGAYLADDNRGLATIGIVDENGKFLSNLYQEGDITRFLNGERQIVPTAWDDEWHLRGIELNTGECTKLGIALAGKNSQMWIDDMALFKVGEGKKYVSANAGGTVSLSYDISDIACQDEDSLIPDPTFSDGSNDFWKTSYGWRNGFLSFATNKYEYGTSLKYTATGDNAPLSIIKTIEVEPNTDYTFAVDLKILEDGWGKLILCDGKIREPLSFLEISFDSYDYDEDAGYYGWYTTVCKFNTDVYDKISLVIVDDGGEALLDNMRLFKSDEGADVTDKFVAPPEENQPEEEPEDDWYEEYPYYPEYPVDPEPPVEDPIVEPEPFDPPVDQPEPVPDNPVAPVVNDEGSDAWIWIAAGGGAALLAGAGVFLFFFLKKKKTTPEPPVE